jgi:sarcosine oxidase, subunit alpha
MSEASPADHSSAGPTPASVPEITFSFEGRTITARPGQSIAAALYAAGQRIFTRSFKYHRPRGLFCASGDCPNCLMQVDGRPNVRTCVTLAKQGQIVRHQNAWPSLGFDILRLFDYLSWFLPVGFYYKRFHKPRWIWPWFERVVRHIAGLGKIDVATTPAVHTEVEHISTDVCVLGGGRAGLTAATQAAQDGARVLILEQQPRLGGRGLFDFLDPDPIVEQLVARTRRHDRIRVLTDTQAFGLYEGNLLGAAQGDRLLKIRAQRYMLCTGARQRPIVFRNNDLPGVFLSDAVLRLARLHGVKVGRRAVIATDQDYGVRRLPAQLRQLGMEIVSVVDLRQGLHSAGSDTPAPVLSSHVVLKALGSKHVKGVRVARASAVGEIDMGSVQTLTCDLLCIASGRVPANELALQAGMRFQYNAGVWQTSRSVEALECAGGAAGTIATDAAHSSIETTSAPSALAKGKRFVCLCEDVTDKDIANAIAEGFDNVETLKRYSTVSMGPCQGKMCGLNAFEICARLTAGPNDAISVTTSRPPLVPVDLCVLAADRLHHTVRRTPLHHWHAAHGATWLDAGQWKRPESYGDPLGEVRAVRTKAGLIDVGTLGKIDVVGPEATQLLERIYLNTWGDLKVGRTRYGVMCTEEGILFDDGVAARRGAEHYYLTATTGNAEAVFQWLELWRATWGLDVTLVNQTSTLGAMNLAGPSARDILSRLTTLDLSPSAFPYQTFREADVAGVPCLLMRLGFVGELGYEIHCPSAAARHLWEAIYEEGQARSLAVFGVEAQRILRLEKGHLLFGVDTDALSNPLEAGLGAMIRFEKPVFHGREPLLRFQARGLRSRLIGFQLAEKIPMAMDVRTMEGCQVVQTGRPVGRVTSMRNSPTLERPLGLAWVPAATSQPGQRFSIRWNGKDVAADVVALPFYDPGMKRLKS